MASPAELSAAVRTDVQKALDEIDTMSRVRRMRETIRDAFLVAFDDLTPAGADASTAADQFVGSMQNMMMLTHPDGSDEQVDRIADIIGTAAVNAAAVAAHPGVSKTWRTMRDDRVRDLHQPMEGVTVGALDHFEVGGFPLQYPGQPVGPPDVWINCRCSLDMGALAAGGAMEDESLEAAISEEPWSNYSASDYSLEQWKRACIITMPGGDPQSKSTYKVPIKTPSGALSRAGVHAAAAALAGARGGVDAPADQKAKARARLRGAYATLGDTPPDSLKASLDEEEPELVAAPGTRDGPGWLTNPRDTQRLRDYWTRGPGAAKIGWGAPGDFNRCRALTSKYVGQYVDGFCANLHKVALGFWPATHAKMDRAGRHAAGEPTYDFDPETEEFRAVSDAFTAAADLTSELPPLEMFSDPGLTAATPLTVSDDGEVVGHLATFDTCHVGVAGSCQLPPRSHRDYAYFRTGEVQTAGGSVPVGQITMDTGHAGTDLGPNAAVSHYDNTGTVVADVAAGEDPYGIWVHGMVRPGISDDQLRALRAGALSGDWRRISGNLELVAALVVNVPGFPIPRTQVASANGMDLALTAAAIVEIDPNALDADRVAVAVLAAMDQRAEDAKRRVRAEQLAETITDLRVSALTAAVEG